MATNDKQVIFSLVNVGKVYPPKKQVLREIYLGFYYGAKIGVLGLNGSGKSSLLKIIAGLIPKNGESQPNCLRLQVQTEVRFSRT